MIPTSENLARGSLRSRSRKEAPAPDTRTAYSAGRADSRNGLTETMSFLGGDTPPLPCPFNLSDAEYQDWIAARRADAIFAGAGTPRTEPERGQGFLQSPQPPC